MNEEIIIHENQTTINDYLIEDNDKCPNCRWCDSNNCCLCPYSNYLKMNVSKIDTNNCGEYYPNNDLEILNTCDDVTGALL